VETIIGARDEVLKYSETWAYVQTMPWDADLSLDRVLGSLIELLAKLAWDRF
jgi:hypothetical protein